MSEKTMDNHGRWRNRTIAFRVSPEEWERIESQVAMSGLSKQEYMANRLLDEEVVVKPNSRVQRALQHEAVDIYHELRRIRNASEISPDLEARIRVFADIFEALGTDCSGESEVIREDALIANIERGRANKGGSD